MGDSMYSNVFSPSFVARNERANVMYPESGTHGLLHQHLDETCCPCKLTSRQALQMLGGPGLVWPSPARSKHKNS